ncbi:hypothetical protein FB446DRAFT_471051 [Lentinula raphanica]|nr:hypothetical protein FB446DRAFT_471051 [Lentinula raphanica]
MRIGRLLVLGYFVTAIKPTVRLLRPSCLYVQSMISSTPNNHYKIPQDFSDPATLHVSRPSAMITPVLGTCYPIDDEKGQSSKTFDVPNSQMFSTCMENGIQSDEVTNSSALRLHGNSMSNLYFSVILRANRATCPLNRYQISSTSSAQASSRWCVT